MGRIITGMVLALWVSVSVAAEPTGLMFAEAVTEPSKTEPDLPISFAEIDCPEKAFFTVATDVIADGAILSFNYKIFWQPAWIHDVGKYVRQNGPSSDSYLVCFRGEGTDRTCHDLGRKLINIPQSAPIMILRDRRGDILTVKKLLMERLFVEITKDQPYPEDIRGTPWQALFQGDGLLVNYTQHYSGRDNILISESTLKKLGTVTVRMENQ